MRSSRVLMVAGASWGRTSGLGPGCRPIPHPTCPWQLPIAIVAAKQGQKCPCDLSAIILIQASRKQLPSNGVVVTIIASRAVWLSPVCCLDRTSRQVQANMYVIKCRRLP